MGDQAARHLERLPLGTPRSFATALTVQLDGPVGYDLDRVARSHGGGGFAPCAYDGHAFTTALPDGTCVRVTPSLRAELSQPTDFGVLRRVLDLDADLTELWAVCDPWVREHRAGRQLRTSSWFEALTQALAATNTSYTSSQRLLGELVGEGGFPSAAAVIGRDLRAWGYRAASLEALARAVDDGVTEGWDELDDDALQDAIRRLRGFGPFAAAAVLPLAGRPRPMVVDGWLAEQVSDLQPFAELGRWGGTALWLEVSRSWLGPARASSPPRSPA